MIYLCQTCGWRIKQRYNNPAIRTEDIGRHLLYCNRAFCSEECICVAKLNPKILERDVDPSDWDECLDSRNSFNGKSTWKIERKKNRKNFQ